MRNTRTIARPLISARRKARLDLLLLLLTVLPTGAQAQYTWTGSGADSNWSTLANWDSNGIPLSSSSAQLDFTGNAATSNNDLGTFSLNLLQFDVSADLTMTGGDLNLVGNNPTLTQNTSFSITLNNNLTLTNGLTVNLDGSGPVTLAGTLSGAGSLTITSNSTTLPDTTFLTNANNSYSGGNILNGGDLNIAADGSLGNPSSGVTFNGGTLQFGAAITSARNLTLNSAGGTADLNGFNGTLSGAISGSGSLTITDTSGALTPGTVTLTNTTNSYTGGTIIAGGTLMLGAGNVLPSGYDLQLIGTSAGTATNATLDLAGQNATVGNLTFGNGPFTGGSANTTLIEDSSSGATGLLTLNGNITFNGGSNPDPAQINGNLSLATGQHTVDSTSLGNISNNYYDIVFAGKIGGNGGLNLSTPSSSSGNVLLSVVLMNSNNTYAGGTNIYQGDLFTGATNSLPTQTAVTIGNTYGTNSGLYLYIDSGRTQPGVKAGSYNTTIGSLANAGTGGGSVFLGAATLTVGANNTSTTYTGTIRDSDPNLSNASGTAVGGSLVKEGTGTLTLGGTANTYTGSTTITGGTLQSGATNALPTTTNLTLLGGAFALNGNNQTLDKVTNEGGNVLVQGGTSNFTANGVYKQTSGNTQVDTTLDLTPGNNMTLTGGDLVGTGTVGNGTSAGTISVTNSGGTVRPGDLLPSVTVGTLTINGTYTQQSGGTMEIDLAGTNSNDLLNVTNASLAGTLNVKLLNGFAPTVGETFNFLDYGTVSGNFASIVGLDPGYMYTDSFANGIGTLTVTAAVPETSTLLTATLILGTGGLLLRRQRRRYNAGSPSSP
jgi:fibronectin-binding autotransporter adhesin